MSNVSYATVMEIERRLLDLSLQAREIANSCGLTRREIAERMGHTSPSTVQRLVNSGLAYNATIETLMRFAAACNHDLVANLSPRLNCLTGSGEAAPNDQWTTRLSDCRRQARRWRLVGADEAAATAEAESSELKSVAG